MANNLLTYLSVIDTFLSNERTTLDNNISVVDDGENRKQGVSKDIALGYIREMRERLDEIENDFKKLSIELLKESYQVA